MKPKSFPVKTVRYGQPTQHCARPSADAVEYVAHLSPSKPAPLLPRTPMEITGPQLWRELHGRAETCDLATELAWLQVAFTGRVSCGECRKHWRELMRDFPPELTSRESYHAWTITAHNIVNARLGKPLFVRLAP